MARKPREVKRLEFSADELAGIVAYMEQLARAEDGWINLVPTINHDDERPTSLGFFTLFGGGGIGGTMCTWIPGNHARSGRNQPSIGITHTAGRRVSALLSSFELPIPATWLVEQDHPRRGLVVRVPTDAPNEQVLAWAIRAIEALRAAGPLRAWRADIYLPTAN